MLRLVKAICVQSTEAAIVLAFVRMVTFSILMRPIVMMNPGVSPCDCNVIVILPLPLIGTG